MGEPRVHLLLLAGGAGRRARARAAHPPKQFANVAGRPLLAWALAELAAAPGVVSVAVTCAVSWRPLVREACAVLELVPPEPVWADPGPSRTASTWHGLQALAAAAAPADDDLVAVHDAARPFASRGLLARLCAAASRRGGAVPGVPVTDTIVSLGEASAGVTYLDRAALRAVQTPQVFRWRALHEAHAWAAAAGRVFTDDGGLLAARGAPPVLVEGEAGNWKVTTAADLARARDILRRRGNAAGAPAPEDTS